MVTLNLATTKRQSHPILVARVQTPAAPPRPHFSEQFEAEFEVDGVLEDNRSVFGEGRAAQDPQGGKAVEELVLQEHSRAEEVHIYFLDRYDLGQEYEITGHR